VNLSKQRFSAGAAIARCATGVCCIRTDQRNRTHQSRRLYRTPTVLRPDRCYDEAVALSTANLRAMDG
jgi:hypothetical protein